MYLPAVTFCAWLGGPGPGLAARSLAAMSCIYTHLPQLNSFRMVSANDQFQLVVFVSERVLVIPFMEMLPAARRRSEAGAKAVKRYHEELGRSETGSSPRSPASS